MTKNAKNIFILIENCRKKTKYWCIYHHHHQLIFLDFLNFSILKNVFMFYGSEIEQWVW